ncbi:hypothetical protein BST11_25455 [Mycobacterium alsense]|uniref:Uncharacterized protein n=1 Tax=Mycobacterium alsense TaxID=324058 RepID=A0ABX3R1Q0_9MYCO|nr:ERF family protein [Mycobacterium alsense]OQZ87912.1 hypothetical protein BST11_25455 [Mycobacterium alsense]
MIHESGQYLTGEWLLTVPCDAKNLTQAEGSDVTYKRRYAEMAITGLVADEDDDGQAAVREVPRTKKGGKRSPLDAAKDKLRDAIEKSGVYPEDFVWVASATEKDVDKILATAEALGMGTAVAS